MREVTFQYVNGIESVTNTPMNTSVVITFPTKHFHYDLEYHRVVGFWQPFTGYHETPGDGPSGGEVIETKIFDRGGTDFVHHYCPPIGMPCPPRPPDRLSWEVNVVGLIPADPPNFMGSRDNVWRDNVFIATASAFAALVFNAGWGNIDLSPAVLDADYRLDPFYGSLVPQGKANILFSFFNYLFPGFNGLPGAYRGLPAIGVVMTEFFNDSINGYYGNTVPWQSQQAFGEIPVGPRNSSLMKR